MSFCFSHNKGFTLIEVLIALFILTFGLLGIAGLSFNSLKRAENSLRQTVAITHITAIIEKQKSIGQKGFDLQEKCQHQLPSAKCKYDNGKLLVCWSKRCYGIEA